MRAMAGAVVLGLILAGGMAVQPAARAATPALVAPQPLSFAEAELLVLDTAPVLADFAGGKTPVIGPRNDMHVQPRPGGAGVYWIQVSTGVTPAAAGAATLYRVDARTAQVFDAQGNELHNPELEAAQRILRQAHGISMVTPASLGR